MCNRVLCITRGVIDITQQVLQLLEDKPPVGASCFHAPGLTQTLEEERPRNLRRLTAHVAPVLERPRGGRRARELVDKLTQLTILDYTLIPWNRLKPTGFSEID